jgi:hypothetical protein
LLGFGAAVVRGLKHRKTGGLRLSEVGLGTLFVVLSVAGSALGAWGLTFLPVDLHHWPTGLLVVGTLVAWSVWFARLTRRVSPLGLHISACLFLTLAALPIALLWPGVAYLLVLPPVFANVGWVTALRWPSSSVPVGALVGLFVAGILWFPLLEGVRIALGAGAIVPGAVGLSLVLVWALPLWRRGN